MRQAYRCDRCSRSARDERTHMTESRAHHRPGGDPLRRFVPICVVALVASCGGSTDGAVLDIVLDDFAFEMRSSTTTGPVLIEAENRGETMHEVKVFRLSDDNGLQEALAHYEDGAENAAPWMHPVAEMSIINPGIRSGFVANLSEPGTYLFACTFPDSEFTLHAALGMLATLEVNDGGSDRVAPEPETTIRIAESDPVVPPLKAGERIVAFQNLSGVPADVSILDSSEAAIDEFEAWVGDGQQGPPPLTVFGGGSVPAGQIRIFKVDLPAGEHRLLTTLRHSSDDLEDRFTTLTVL
jgi:uncharacterized cupredoxin-like copper-binding protein